MPPTLMVASAVRDKYGQSEAITMRAEEASEIMKRMEKKWWNALIPDSHYARVKKVLFVAHHVAVNDTHGLQRLVHVSVSLLSTLQLSLSLFCNINQTWGFKQSRKVPKYLPNWNSSLDEPAGKTCMALKNNLLFFFLSSLIVTWQRHRWADVG